MANNNVGPKRLVVGAHYGMRDWLAQRITAIIMAVYTVIILVTFLTGKDFSYNGWAGMFSMGWFRLATSAAFVALFYHVWVGMRDIWMDYVKPVGLRLTLQIATLLWLIVCAVWAARILWRF